MTYPYYESNIKNLFAGVLQQMFIVQRSWVISMPCANIYSPSSHPLFNFQGWDIWSRSRAVPITSEIMLMNTAMKTEVAVDLLLRIHTWPHAITPVHGCLMMCVAKFTSGENSAETGFAPVLLVRLKKSLVACYMVAVQSMMQLSPPEVWLMCFGHHFSTRGQCQGFFDGDGKCLLHKTQKCFAQTIVNPLCSCTTSSSPFRRDTAAGHSSIYPRLRQGCSFMRSRKEQCKLQRFTKLGLYITLGTGSP